MDDVRVVMDELQAGYGDATQGVLDRQVARAVLRRLRELGWAAPEDVAALVVAAGGEIRVTDRVVEDTGFRDRFEVRRMYEPETFTTVLRARAKTEARA